MNEAGERRTLGRYALLELIGRGSVTDAFRAKSFGVEGFEKTVVVKRVLPDLAAKDAFLGPFLEHVQRAMRLSHANLAQIFNLGRGEEDAGTSYFLATEYVAGLDVGTLLERSRVLSGVPLPIAAYLGLEVAKALDHAHRRRDEQLRPLGLVHGAVAPHNVLVSFEGDVKVTDFGVIRAALSLPRPKESLRQSYAFLSPEQARGTEPTVSSDVFSLGCFLYAALCGASPFAGPSASETLRNAASGDFEPVDAARRDVPPALVDLIHRALSRDPDERHGSVSLLYEELLSCTYASGFRCTAHDLAAFVDTHREPPETIPGESIDVLLSRPLTLPPLALDPEPLTEETPRGRPTSVPPLTGFGEMRHVTALVLSLRQEGPLPDTLGERMHAVFDRYGGTVVHESDGEVVAFFGLDRSDGRDTEIAVRCGLVLVRGLDVAGVMPSVGIDAGRLRQGVARTPLSDGRAARLVAEARALAAPAEPVVVVSRRIAASLRGRFPLDAFGADFRVTEFTQDGFTDSFVGRRAELQNLGETLVRAARGDLRLMSIVGNAGVGKTRLAVEMQRRLSRGSVDLRTYFATCPPRGRELPLSGIVTMLRRVCGVRDGDPIARIEALEPRLRATGLDTDEAQAVLAELGAARPSARLPVSTALRSAVLQLMHSLSEDRFTVFIWDDAHELDAASCDLLNRAAARLSTSRLALVLSARPDAGAPFGALPFHAELTLEEMDPADVDRLVAERIGVENAPAELLEFLRNRARGQPMFVEEILRELEDGGALRVADGQVVSLSLDLGVKVPRTLRALIGDRLGRLPDDGRHLFVAAAVLEPPVQVEVLASMVELPLPAVDGVAESLVARGLLARDGPAAFGFPSPLAREVVLAELDAEDLANLHRRAASAHIGILGPRLDEEADSVGYHLAAAGDRDAAADFYARGGLYALAARKLDRAALDLAYALDLTDLETRSPAQIGNWLEALSTAVRYVRTGASLPSLIERLVQRVEGEGLDPNLRARMRINLASILGALDQEAAAEAILERGAADASADPGVVTAYLALHAELASTRGEFRLARRALDALVRTQLTDKVELHRVTLSMARTLAAAGKIEAAEAALAEASTMDAADDPLLAIERSAVQTALCESAGRFREGAEGSFQAAALAEELGLIYEVASSLSEQAVYLARLGDLARARAAVASAVSAAEEASAERVLTRCRMIAGYLDASDATASLDVEREHIAFAESRGWITDALRGRFFLAKMAARQGAVDEARHELVLGSRIATSTGNASFAEQFAGELAKLG